MASQQVLHYFPGLSELQIEQFDSLPEIYKEWNAQINLISRKDMDHFVERHLIHSLAISQCWQVSAGHRILDIGTGGGFPGIPLAILHPELEFTLSDSIGKKIKVVMDVAQRLNLKNVVGVNDRVENLKGTYQVATARAVSRLEKLVNYCTKPKLKISKLYCLKGGDLRDEVHEIDQYPSRVFELSKKFQGVFFETKKVVFVQF